MMSETPLLPEVGERWDAWEPGEGLERNRMLQRTARVMAVLEGKWVVAVSREHLGGKPYVVHVNDWRRDYKKKQL